MATTFIYALCDPDTRKVRYIGKSNNPQRRLGDHLSFSIKLDTHLGYWLSRLRDSGTKPNLIVLREVPEEIWQEEEIGYIRQARVLGMDLVNTTDGGEGIALTPEILAKRSATRTGVKKGPLPPEWRAAISAATKGVPKGPFSPEHCAAMKKPKSPECRAAMRKPKSPEHRANMIRKRSKVSSSKFFGVCWHAPGKKWRVRLRLPDGKRLSIGCFKDEIEAARAHDAAAIQYYGPSAKLNFPTTSRGS